MPKEKTIDELIEDERKRNEAVRKKVKPFIRPEPKESEAPEEKEEPIEREGFVDTWKTGVKRIFGK